MTVSARVDYACRALLELSSRYETRQPVPLRQITGTHAIPAQFLAQILQQLKSVGMIQSTRGACGGYRLSRDPAEISLWDVVVAIEGQPRSEPAEADSAMSRCLRRTWDDLSEYRASQLRATTLQSLLDEARVDAGTMYYI
jgi:Rrf2 family protein